MTIRTQFNLPESFQIYSATKPKFAERDYVVCPFDNAVGIEIEVENVSEDLMERSSPSGWSMTDDGSLRNNGREYISRPTAANTVHWSLARLMEKHLDSNEQSFSPRTSMHLHVNCRDLEIDDVKTIIRFYSIFERLLYRFCGRSRYKNIYCVPLVDTSLMSTFPSAFPNTRGWPKYAGLNAAPLMTQGTLEFRHMHGTFDVDKIMVWINLVLSLFNYVKGKNTKTLHEELIACYDENAYLDLMTRVFQGHRGQLNYKNKEDYIYSYNNMLSSLSSGSNVQIAPHAAIQGRV